MGTSLIADIDAMESAISTALSGPVSVLNRMRLACIPLDADGKRLKTFKPSASISPCSCLLCIALMAVPEAGWQVMNEVTLHRGRTPHLLVADAFFDGAHLTEAVVRPFYHSGVQCTSFKD